MTRFFSGGAAWLGAALFLSQQARATAASAEEPQSIEHELATLEADAGVRQAAAEAIARSKGALKRAQALESKDSLHARLAVQAAVEWLGVARDLRRAVQAERRARQLETELTALQKKLADLRRLLGQNVARRGRLEVLVRRLEHGDPPAGSAAPSGTTSAPDPTPTKPAEKP